MESVDRDAAQAGEGAAAQAGEVAAAPAEPPLRNFARGRIAGSAAPRPAAKRRAHAPVLKPLRQRQPQAAAKRPRLLAARGRGCAEELRLEACPGCAAASPVLSAALTRAALLHLLYARGQIPCVWSVLLQQQAAATAAAAAAAAEAAPGGTHRRRRTPMAQRRGEKYIAAVERLLADCSTALLGGCRRAVMLFGPTPINPVEIYELRFPCAPGQVGTEANGAGAGAAPAPEGKAVQRLCRQLLRVLVMEAQPKRDLKPCKLWLLLEVRRPAAAAANPAAGAAGGPGGGTAAGPPAAFAAKPHLKLPLLRQRAKLLCDVRLGPPEDSGQGPGEPEQGWLWMQSTAVVGALGRKDWSQIAA